MAQTVAKSQDSPEDVAAAIAEDHAAAVEFPSMMFADDAPVGEVAQRMVDGRYDKAFLISEIERFTGVKAGIPSNPGKVVFVIPQHGYWSFRTDADRPGVPRRGIRGRLRHATRGTALPLRRQHGHHVPRSGVERGPGLAG